jgi:hypothetical protein
MQSDSGSQNQTACSWALRYSKFVPHACLVVLLVNTGLLLSRGRTTNQIAIGSQDIPSTSDSGEVIELITRAERGGNAELAEVYTLNGIRQHPTEVNLLEKYAELALQSPENSPQRTRARTAIENSLFSVAPSSIPSVQKLLESFSAESQPAKPEKPKPDVNLIKTLIAKLPDEEGDVEWMRDHVESLEGIALALGNDGAPELIDLVGTEILRWELCLIACKQTEFIESCLYNLASLDENGLRSQLAVALAQAAESSLPTLWAIDLKVLPEATRDRVEGYPEQVKSWVDKIANARSRVLLAQLESLKLEADEVEAEQREAACLRIESILMKAQGVFTEIPSKQSQAEAAKTIASITQQLKRERQSQFDEYQQFVLSKCDLVFSGFSAEWAVSKKDALKLFNDNKLYEVDLSLLSPEVSMCFNDVLNKLLVELSPKQVVECQKKMGSKKKKTLTEF